MHTTSTQTTAEEKKEIPNQITYVYFPIAMSSGSFLPDWADTHSPSVCLGSPPLPGLCS